MSRVKDFVVSEGLVDVPERRTRCGTDSALSASDDSACIYEPRPFGRSRLADWVTAPAPGEPADIREACLLGHCSYGIPITCS